ncbi:chorismate-binding protein [Bdellovibrio bacteriovorus]|uniref:chorismate-binding protein n=1 Tax=Bdellovibrio bacteriovorus TaxID=959 RepID=UPI0020A33A47|nr:chorismate-binding protein [Bdellovibrio bacteriovorus]
MSQSPPVPESLGSMNWQEPEKSDFATDLEIIQGKIQKGEIQKAVPVIFARTSQTVTAVHRAQMLLSLINAPPSLYVYGFWQNGEGVLGATPETLFEYSKGTLKTMALAGTCPKEDATHREFLLQDEKEMHEHLLVLEDIKSVLKPLGEIKTEGPQILELPTLFHLFTKINVDCQRVPSFTNLIESLHPTPALGVAPRNYGYKWMEELPGQEGRARYGAPFAFLSKEEALCLVGIRNIQWNKASSMIGSGCGIVAASDLEREWRELYQKRLSVRKILGLNL